MEENTLVPPAKTYDWIVIGGGAAGCFGALAAAQAAPRSTGLVLEKSNAPLKKVKISGGGRCNVTNAEHRPAALAKAYPRGGKQMKRLLKQFGQPDTVDWFAKRGVQLKTEPDGRMFPITDESQTVIDCLLGALHKAGVPLTTRTGVREIFPLPGKQGYGLHTTRGDTLQARCVLLAAGGLPKPAQYNWLAPLGLPIVPPVPSLFTFNVPASPLEGLEGLSVAETAVSVEGQKNRYGGPTLVTHWGLSGPAVLKGSAWEARHLAAQAYRYNVQVNWLPQFKRPELEAELESYRHSHPNALIRNHRPEAIPKRLWERLCTQAGIPESTTWANLKRKAQNLLAERLQHSRFVAEGKTTYKDEFVTAGGIDLRVLEPDNLELCAWPGLFAAGELLNIDGITGGYNFQAAWSSGWVAGTAMGQHVAAATERG